jgi:hypothetical protein
VAATIMVSPNGQANQTFLYDISESGARIGLPENFEHGDGALVRLYFRRRRARWCCSPRSERVSFDHLGVEFAENQEELVLQLIDELSDG